MMDHIDRIQALVDWLQVRASDAHGLLVPVSGGSDSALGFWLCARAFPEKTIAIHAGSRNTLRRSDWLESIAPIEYVETPGEYFEREEMRWARFTAFSIKQQRWLVSCRNRTETVLGTYSLASRVATFMPLDGTWKTHVMGMCRTIGVPEEIIASSQRADPDCGRPQEMAEIPFDHVDAYLQHRSDVSCKHSLNEAQRRYLESVIERNGFKRTLPIHGPIL
jgi:NH3-dependent NAD+ synthetase